MQNNYKDRLALSEVLPIVLGVDLKEHHYQWLNNYEKDEFIVKIDGMDKSERTSFILALLSIQTVLNQNQTSLVICGSIKAMPYAQCVQSFAYVQKTYDYISAMFQIPNSNDYVLRKTQQEFLLTNNSRMTFLKQSACVKGRSLNNLFVDTNITSIEDLDSEIVASLLPCCVFGGKFIVSLEA